MDTLRVMGRRILVGVSPFNADAGHLHHFLSRIFHSTRKALVLMLLTATLLTGVGMLGLAHQVGEAAIFYSALLVFIAYLFAARYVHRLSAALEQRDRQIVAEGA
jgi:UDP-GlcNAc:undecaprenyl-phosphate GlcNAc-1-phosphate transferase